MSHQPVSILALKAVTTTGVGGKSVIPAHAKHTLEVVLTGAPATCVVTLHGAVTDSGDMTLATWTLGTVTSGQLVYAVDKPVTRIWASLDTLTGGTAPTVTANILSTS